NHFHHARPRVGLPPVGVGEAFRGVHQILSAAVADEGAVGERRREDLLVTRGVLLVYVTPVGPRKHPVRVVPVQPGLFLHFAGLCAGRRCGHPEHHQASDAHHHSTHGSVHTASPASLCLYSASQGGSHPHYLGLRNFRMNWSVCPRIVWSNTLAVRESAGLARIELSESNLNPTASTSRRTVEDSIRCKGSVTSAAAPGAAE